MLGLGLGFRFSGLGFEFQVGWMEVYGFRAGV